MYANDLRKGMRVRLNSGLWATMMDNKKGPSRNVEIKGPNYAMGSVYVKDILLVLLEDGTVEPVELSPRQQKQAATAALLGF